MKDFTKLGVLGGVSLLADLMTLTPYVKKVLQYIGMSIEAAELTNHIVSWLATMGVGFSFVILIIVLFTHKKITDAGTHGIACSIAQFINFRVKNNTSSLLNAIHRDIYHYVCTIKKDIAQAHNNNPEHTYTLSDFSSQMLQLLQHFHTVLLDVFQIDSSISIYRVSETDGQKLIMSRDFFLKSEEERTKSSIRNVNHKYLIVKDSELAIDELYKRAKRYNENNGRGTYLKNSIFDFILSSTHNSWISNDLGLDNRNNVFFTSSPNYKNFYKSLAVFAILPPDCNNNRDAAIKGILTFDTQKTGMFLEKECVAIMGLMAHVVNEIMESIN